MLKRIKVSELSLGQIVKLSEDTFMWGTVVKIDEEKNATVLRPFVHTADFSMSGSVISYLGQEECVLYHDHEVEANSHVPIMRGHRKLREIHNDPNYDVKYDSESQLDEEIDWIGVGTYDSWYSKDERGVYRNGKFPTCSRILIRKVR